MFLVAIKPGSGEIRVRAMKIGISYNLSFYDEGAVLLQEKSLETASKSKPINILKKQDKNNYKYILNDKCKIIDCILSI